MVWKFPTKGNLKWFNNLQLLQPPKGAFGDKFIKKQMEKYT